MLTADKFKRVGYTKEEAERIDRPTISYWQDAWRRLKKNPVAMASLVGLILIMVIVGPYIRGYDFVSKNVKEKNQGMSAKYWFGTDYLGRDLFSRVWMGARASIIIALVATALKLIVGTLYGAAGIIAFNLLFFTLQISLFTRKKFHPKIFLTPLNISTLALIFMLIFHVHFPRPLQTVCSNIGGITTPMALIIVGVMLADGNLFQIVTEKRAYVISLIRNLICPLIMLVVMALLPLDPNLRMAVLIYVACPVANLTSVYAIQHDMEPALCARATLLSTILFAATIPFIIWLGQLVYGV